MTLGEQIASIFGVGPGLAILSLAVAAAVFAWGFLRYRRTFSRAEFLVTTLIGLGVLSIGVLPGLFLGIAELLRLSETFRAVQIAANLAFLVLLLYLLSVLSETRSSVDGLSRRLAVQQAPGGPAPDPSVYVVIPAYDEADTVGTVVDSLPASVLGHAVRAIVVSDGSRDRTAEIARSRGAVAVEHPLNRGQGGAIRTGMEIADRHGADVVVTMDADGQHPPDQIADLVAPIVGDEADCVLGSRYRGEDTSDNSLVRRAGIRALTRLVNLLADTDLTDCTNGFRAIRGSRLPELRLTEARFSAPELIIESRKNRLRIREVPVTVRERAAGETKKPGLRYALGLTRTTLLAWLR